MPIRTIKHIHSLTGLRGLAALIVFISHSANFFLLPIVLGNGFGQLGVMLFFLLSGYLMAHLYINEDFDCSNVKRFAMARAARVLPLYYLIILFSIAITKYINHDFAYNFSLDNIDDLLPTVLLAYAPSILWTIPVEFQFYLAFIGIWYLRKINASAYILIAYALITMIPSFYAYYVSDKTLNFYVSGKTLNFVSSYSYAFFLGVATSLFHARIKNLLSQHKDKLALFGVVVLILFCLNLPALRLHLGLTLSQDLYFRTWWDPITWAIIYCFFVCAALNVPSFAFLNWRPFVYLGNISYGFYLFHYPVLESIKNIGVPPFARCIIAFAITAVLAYMSYRYFETPFRKVIRNLSSPAVAR